MLSVIAITAYTATVMVHSQTARFHLDTPVAWSLNDGEQTGTSHSVPVFIDSLVPDATYTFRIAEQQVTFKTATCNGLVDATDYGVNTSAEDNAQAFSRAIVAVPVGGTLKVPPGRYVCGPIFLKTDMTLLLCEGAEIAAMADRRAWPILPAYDDNKRVIGTWEGLPEASFASTVTAIDCNRLSITGRGVIDGGGDRGDWWTWPKQTRDGARRPRTLYMAHCCDVVLSGFTVRNSPSWTVHPYRCERVSVVALQVTNPANSPNTDGIDPESCTDMQLLGLRISVGDDCVAVKAGKRGTGDDERINHIAPTRRLTIQNCLMLDGHGAVVMGSEMSGEITDVTIARCEFKGTDRGLRIKTRRGRGGLVARISMFDVGMENVGTAMAVNAFYFCDADGKSEQVQSRQAAPVNDTTPHIHDISVEKIDVKNVQHAVAALLGLPEAPLKAISLANINISYDPGALAGEVLMACQVPETRHGGILYEFAEISVDDVLKVYLQDLACVN